MERLTRSEVEPHRRVVTAKALLALADGPSVRATAKSSGSHEVSFGSGPVRRLTSRLGPPLDDAGWLRSPHAMDDK